jgi:hypothetical protein
LLAQARDGGQHDFRVQTEWAYYLMKSAWKKPRSNDAEARIVEGSQILLDQIEGHGKSDFHPWHIYGSQMLAWLRRASLPPDERARQLEVVKSKIEDGVRVTQGNLISRVCWPTSLLSG